ncbi:hypothetical protein ACA910_011881 [Epithemia clementina (nom. ined.)]
MKSGFFCRSAKAALTVAPVVVCAPVWPKQPDTTATQAADDNGTSTERAYPLADAAPRSPVRIFNYTPNFQVAFDTRTRNPVYVIERLVVGLEEEKTKSARFRRPRFYSEPELSELFQSRNSHYQGTEYDRGHMAPAANFTIGTNNSERDFVKSFVLTNTSPQDSTLNRTLWAQLEAWTRRVAQTAAETWQQQQQQQQNNKHNNGDVIATYVVTGPLWLPKRQVAERKFQFQFLALGQPPQTVAVPTHFYKVVVVVQERAVANSNNEISIPQIKAFSCFVVPNESNSYSNNNRKNTESSFARYLVCWTDLEAVTGLEFFPNWVNWEWKLRANELTIREMEGQPLLLPDSRLLSATSEVVKYKNKNAYSRMQHLCADGNCLLSAKNRQQ